MSKKINKLWIIILLFVSIFSIGFFYYSTFYKPKQKKETFIKNLYYDVFISDEQVYDWCHNELIKPGQTVSLSEIIKSDYTCKCVVDENKKSFIKTISDKELKEDIENGIENLINMPLDLKIQMVNIFIPICYGEVEDKGLEYFEKKYKGK